MIKKITEINNIGIYRGYRWPVDLPEFSKFNLIYGWNYSGKTTLSRLFGALEKPQTISQLGGQFTFQSDDDSLIGSVGLDQGLNCRVFNRGFIDRNFQQEHNAPAVFIVGDEAGQIRSRITSLKARAEKIKRATLREEQKKSDWSRRVNDGLKRNEARNIADLVSDRSFNRPSLDRLIQRVRGNPDSFRLSVADFDALKATAGSSEQFGPLSDFTIPNIDIELILERVGDLLGQTASNNAVGRLAENSQLEAWVREGRSLHTEGQSCGFCGGELSKERLALLAGHFSTEYEALVAQVKAEIQTLAAISIEVVTPSSEKLVPSLREEYQAMLEPLAPYVASLSVVLKELAESLEAKVSSLETAGTLTVDALVDLEVTRAFSLSETSANISRLLERHTEMVEDIEVTKSEAKENLKHHAAAVFFQESSIGAEELELEKINRKLTLAQRLERNVDERITEKEDEIRLHSVAIKKLNDLIEPVLAGCNLSAIQLGESEFEFRRGAEKAENLSDGERTAIAFCYFLLTLEDAGNALVETLVFVDDPISSLDSNHIYSIYALIMERLKDKCRQLFVSTHNSEFFNLLKDDCLNGNRNFKQGCAGFYTKRNTTPEGQAFSELVGLPVELRKNKSEYQFVFSLLHEFSRSDEPTVYEAYTAPTLVRKLLEAYLGFRKPSGGGWSGKLSLLFEDEATRREIDKFVNDASHLQGINRMVQHAEYISSSKEYVEKVLLSIQEFDPVHYESLEAVVVG